MTTNNNQELNSNIGKIPVSVITGFLGAGKTTFLNHILSNPNGKKYAVIVNEFGEIGIDSGLVIGVDEEIFELNNGCLCCNVRGDLIRILNSLFRRKTSFDAILIETTGLANPAPVAQTFFADDDISRQAYLSEIITIVDAKHILQSLNEFKEAVHQIAFADILILNKIDSVSEQEIIEIKAAIKSINNGVKIIETNNSNVDHNQIIGGYFDAEKSMAIDEYFIEEKSHEHNHHEHHHDHHNHDHHHHNHYDGVQSLSLEIDTPIDEGKFTHFLSTIIDRYGEQLLRFKGIINVRGQSEPFVINGVHMMVDAQYREKWPENSQKKSRMVFIGKDLPISILKAGFESSI